MKGSRSYEGIQGVQLDVQKLNILILKFMSANVAL